MKKILSTATLIAMIASIGVQAANLRQDRRLIEEAIEGVQNQGGHRRPGPGRDGFRQAEENFSIVQRDIQDLRQSREKMDLERALDSALRSLRDFRMPPPFKVNHVVNFGNEALRSIDQLMQMDRGNVQLDRAIDSLRRSVEFVRNQRLREAEDMLRDTKGLLREFARDNDIELARREIEMLEQRLADRYIGRREKEMAAEQHVRFATDAILRSRAYRDEGREGRDVLGRTRPFASRGSSTETIDVDMRGRQDRIRALRLTAKDADVRLDVIEVTFNNGRSESFYGGTILRDQDLTLDLRGGDRLIQRIRITGQSMGRHRDREAHVVIRGVN